MSTLTNQVTNMPINQKCRQLNPLGIVFHIMKKAPAMPKQIGEIERTKIKAVLRQFFS
jgi:hypothetical protein